MKRVDFEMRPFQIHDSKCNGLIVGKGFKHAESGLQYYCCINCNKRRINGSFRDKVSSLKVVKTTIANDVVNDYLLIESSFRSDRSLNDLSRIDAISVITEYFKGTL